ncbi:serine hydrolase domain-containing protein [Nakamurella flava]|uniref:serine hydrolase domain-containing protein n=1 Tax=Nakamurella flava TaxID=2576308 RepID=UPI00140E10B8|nr:serine hydrolase domain-containing protein [Nakamurella flava]
MSAVRPDHPPLTSADWDHRLGALLDPDAPGAAARGVAPGSAWWVGGVDGPLSRGAVGRQGTDRRDASISVHTPFRWSSVTKPVVAALALALLDEGTLTLDAPVDRWLPELADRRVLSEPLTPDTDVATAGTVPARRPILVRDVLEFRLGWGMDFTGPWPDPLLVAMAGAGLAAGPPAPQVNPEPDEWLRRLGRFPLARQPGEQWRYHTGASVLGVLLARAGGAPLPELLQRRVLGPVGMTGTAFWADADRLGPHWAPAAGPDPRTPALACYDPADGQWSRPPAFPDAGDGLVGPVDDLAALARTLLAGGVTPDGRRVLSTGVVAAATRSRIGPIDQDGAGWGLGMGVRHSATPDGRSAGSFGWDGGMGASWWVDPTTGRIGVLATNLLWSSPQPPPVFGEFWSLAFGGSI